MNSFVKASLIAAMMTAPLMADESFGGVGITIYQVGEGVHVAEVIPGTPAAETNLRAGDVITSVDGVSLKGQNIEFSKSKLRGQVNKPLEITYTSNGETYSAVIRRAQITVKDLDNKAVKNWYGDKERVNAQELETFASATENDKQLVAVLSRGNLIKNDVAVASAEVNGIYVEKAKTAPKFTKTTPVRAGDASLRLFNRKAIAFTLKSPGRATVTIMTADGEQVATLNLDNAIAGVNTLNWNGAQVPSGRYVISIDHNGAVSGANAVLK
ncbi:MAG: PDZ domain-containing protein [Fibrobacter sp.]|nr:PDZ domain-containing protein [Fibrobacter sp.]